MYNLTKARDIRTKARDIRTKARDIRTKEGDFVDNRVKEGDLNPEKLSKDAIAIKKKAKEPTMVVVMCAVLQDENGERPPKKFVFTSIYSPSR